MGIDCTTHHHACACREAHYAKTEALAEQLASALGAYTDATLGISAVNDGQHREPPMPNIYEQARAALAAWNLHNING